MEHYAGDLLGVPFESRQDLLRALVKDNDVFIRPAWNTNRGGGAQSCADLSPLNIHRLGTERDPQSPAAVSREVLTALYLIPTSPQPEEGCPQETGRLLTHIPALWRTSAVGPRGHNPRQPGGRSWRRDGCLTCKDLVGVGRTKVQSKDPWDAGAVQALYKEKGIRQNHCQAGRAPQDREGP